MGYKVNDVVRTGGVPTHLVERFLKHLPISEFIETGTAGGGSARWAAEKFEKVITIELLEGRAEIDTSIPNIKWLTGHTVDHLENIITGLVSEKPAHGFKYVLFWLDAHYTDPEPNTSDYKECYILEELEVISHYDQDSIIIIDDARLFCGQPPHPNNPKDWATIQEIFKFFSDNYKWHYTTIIDDYIVSVPDRIKWILDEEWRENYKNRYPDEPEKLKQQARAVYSAVIEYLKP